MADAAAAAEDAGQRRRYFAFICMSTAFRSFEAGIVSSMMPQIREELGLDFTREGVIAAAPDYGIVPAGLLAIAVFSYAPAYPVLTSGNFVIAAVTTACAVWPVTCDVFYMPVRWVWGGAATSAHVAAAAATCADVTPLPPGPCSQWAAGEQLRHRPSRPSLASLVTARAVSGLFWGLAAVHYPAWINAKGDPARRTTWLAMCVLTMRAPRGVRRCEHHPSTHPHSRALLITAATEAPSRSVRVTQRDDPHAGHTASRRHTARSARAKRRAPTSSETITLAVVGRYNAMLLIGILVGYAVGGVCSSVPALGGTRAGTWVVLYAIEARAVFCFCMPAQWAMP